MVDLIMVRLDFNLVFCFGEFLIQNLSLLVVFVVVCVLDEFLLKVFKVVLMKFFKLGGGQDEFIGCEGYEFGILVGWVFVSKIGDFVSFVVIEFKLFDGW